MTYRRTHFQAVDFQSPNFLAVLELARDGSGSSAWFIVGATMPIIKNLAKTDDEISLLILKTHSLIYCPAAATVQDWGKWVRTCLRFHLLNHRRGERRRSARERTNELGSD